MALAAIDIFNVAFRKDGVTGELRPFSTLQEFVDILALTGGDHLVELQARGDQTQLYNGPLNQAPSGIYTIRGPGSLNKGVGRRLAFEQVFTWEGTLTVYDQGVNPRYVLA